MSDEIICIMKPNTPTAIKPMKQIFRDSLSSSKSGFLDSFSTFPIERKESGIFITAHLLYLSKREKAKVQFNFIGRKHIDFNIVSRRGLIFPLYAQGLPIIL